MINKILLCALAVCSLSDAAMIGDFSPMKVGNKWVYSGYAQSWIVPRWSKETLEIIAMNQNGDSLFYTISDSISSWSVDTTVTKTIKKYLELNTSNFLYDSSSKTYGPPEDHFKFHQLPDSILKKVDFVNQSLFSYSDTTFENCSSGSPFKATQWIQNFGLVSSSSSYTCTANPDHGSYSELKLVSFNDQPVDTPITAIMPKSPSLASSGNPLLYTNTRNQITWRGLSAQDRLCLQLYDYRGKLLFSSRQLPGTYVLNTSRYSSGAFLLRYRVNNGIWRQFPLTRN